MSKPWKHDGNVVWIRPDDHASARKARFNNARAQSGMGLGPWLAAAIAAGLAIGTFGVPHLTHPQAAVATPNGHPGKAIQSAVPRSTRLRTAAATPDSDPREAMQSGVPRGSAARDDAVRIAFSTCKWGGGTNCVVDGDTFWIGGEKVRIAGIDAPETHPPRCDYEARMGDQATEKLRALLSSGPVTMTSIDRDRDKYGRLLRNVQVNGADVGEAMVGAGVAREYAGGRRPWC